MAKVELTQEQKDRANSEARAILDRVLRGESKFDEGVEKPKPKPRPKKARPEESQRGANLKRYDGKEIARLHTEEGLTSYEIAAQLGAHRKTVVNSLKKQGLWESTTGGRPKRDFCERGHNQAEHRVETSPGQGDWHCGKCKLDRNAEYKREQAAKKRDNRLQKHGNGWMLILEGVEVGILLTNDDTAVALDSKLTYLSSPKRRS